VQAKPIEDASSLDDLVVALDGLVDERGSPKKTLAAPGTPILQPTDERRRTGSHYTPRSLTAPIVKYALEPAFARLGPDATADQVLDLKVCDPAMGSGAFLVEACRALGERLMLAWTRWPETRPTIPADEDEELHARRLVAQRCLYGVDKNPRAVDLARLSLWLATLARDHEFTFLDHALKSGDSLVGLTPAQIAAANWDETKPGLPLFRQLVRDRVAEAETARAEIQCAPDDTARIVQEQRHRHVETRLTPVRVMGDAVLWAFFAADKAKAREKARAEVESQISGMPPRWDQLTAAADRLRSGERGIPPFHWQLEFPEVFARENGGFDAVIGNPPFLGGAKIWPSLGHGYPDWLRAVHPNSGGKAVDLVAHFFRRSYDLLRSEAAFGLVGTKTIAEGDTREAGLMVLRELGAHIFRAQQGILWPGEADVFVSVIHATKGFSTLGSLLNGKVVSGINSFLLPTSLEYSAKKLKSNKRKSFRGCDVYGQGFIFSDDEGGGQAGSIKDMEELIARDQRNSEVIMPFIGGKELATDPQQSGSRYAINFAEMSLAQAETWSEIFEIVKQKVKPSRDKLGGYSVAIRRRDFWWQYGTYTPALYREIAGLERVLAISRVTTYIAFSFVNSKAIFNEMVIIFPARAGLNDFAVLNSRIHEMWALVWGTTLGETPRYSPPECFETFPFPERYEVSALLRAVADAYDTLRSEVMCSRQEGLTKTYNRFHARSENATDIARLRTLHHEMDVMVLRAYGWDDLADRAAPEFIEQEADEGKSPKTRLDWPAGFKDEVLARLLALNATRAAGLTAVADEDDGDIDDGDDAD
jgi:hypothetical protein